MAVARMGLFLFAFPRVRGITSRVVQDAIARPAEWPEKVRRAVIRASRSLPGSTCLAQSLVAERLLLQAGCEARLSIGVARLAGRGSLDAHAWVESGGMLITGDDPHQRYEVLATLGRE